LNQARGDQLAVDVAELEQDLRAAKEVKEDAVRCVLAARQGTEAAEERVREAAGDGTPVQLLYRLSPGPSGPRDEWGAQLVQMFKKELRKAAMLLDNKKSIQNSKTCFLYFSTNHISEPDRETVSFFLHCKQSSNLGLDWALTGRA
jgi:hypothetical protein